MQDSPNHDITLNAMRKIFKNYRGSQQWAAASIGVKPPTISRYLSGQITSPKLEKEMPRLAERLHKTRGKCMGKDVDGQSVRAKVTRDRRRK